MNQIVRRFCLTHSSGEDIYLFTLRNAAGTEVGITNYGAIITAFKIKKTDGNNNDIMLGFDKVEDYWSQDYLRQYPWFGCAIGRYANRIKNASFDLDGTRYTLSKNWNNEHLHGGREGFDRKVWEPVSFGHAPHLYLELKYKSRDGEEGFPGNLETTVRFELTDQNELSYCFKASCDKATPINLTHHGYFNLHNGSKTIEDHEIKIYASKMLEQDAHLVVTGELKPVEGTAFDFREFYSIQEGLKKVDEYDKSFIVDHPANADPVLVAEARNRQSGMHLQIYSTEPIVHFYSGKWIPEVKGKDGILYGAFWGFCLETHKYPNAVNIPGFPNTILRPGETYYQKTTYRINQVLEK